MHSFLDCINADKGEQEQNIVFICWIHLLNCLILLKQTKMNSSRTARISFNDTFKNCLYYKDLIPVLSIRDINLTTRLSLSIDLITR